MSSCVTLGRDLGVGAQEGSGMTPVCARLRAAVQGVGNPIFPKSEPNTHWQPSFVLFPFVTSISTGRG